MKRILPALLAALGLVLLFVTPAHASSPGWIDICQYSHSLPDDPVVFPGLPGDSHLHDFLGNNSTNANSTYTDMIAQESPWNSTCPQNTRDVAAYWSPAFYEGPTHILPCQSQSSPRCTLYYRDDNVSSAYRAAHLPEPWPAGFKMIAGNSHAQSEADSPYLGREIYYGCSNNSTGKLKSPPNCSTGIISVHIGFPNCWNGTDYTTDTGGYNSLANSLRYPSSGVCPTGFDHLLPRLIIRLEIPVGTTTDDPSWSSGAYYTVHSDFWNTWPQDALTSLVSRCLAAGGGVGADCGNNPTP